MAEKPATTADVTLWEDAIAYQSVYTTGPIGERFLKELRDNSRIMGTRCTRCKHIYVPARLFCPLCFQQLEEWVDVGLRGTVYSFTSATTGPSGEKLGTPQLYALIRMRKAEGGFLHKLGEVGRRPIRIGMNVEAVFKDKSERVGSILDIDYFKPVD